MRKENRRCPFLFALRRGCGTLPFAERMRKSKTLSLFLYFFEQLLHIVRQIERALVQIRVVVSGFEAEAVPPVRVEVAHGMHAAG